MPTDQEINEGWECVGGAWRYKNFSPFPVGMTREEIALYAKLVRVRYDSK